KDIIPGAESGGAGELTNVNGTLFFSVMGRELWKSDGTEAGTVFIKDFGPPWNGSTIWGFTSYMGALYFLVNTNGHEQVWTSDGTEAGTTLFEDIHPGPMGAELTKFVVINGTLMFQAENGVRAHLLALWRSDGTTEGTRIQEIRGATSASSHPIYLTAAGSAV